MLLHTHTRACKHRERINKREISHYLILRCRGNGVLAPSCLCEAVVHSGSGGKDLRVWSPERGGGGGRLTEGLSRWVQAQSGTRWRDSVPPLASGLLELSEEETGGWCWLLTLKVLPCDPGRGEGAVALLNLVFVLCSLICPLRPQTSQESQTYDYSLTSAPRSSCLLAPIPPNDPYGRVVRSSDDERPMR